MHDALSSMCAYVRFIKVYPNTFVVHPSILVSVCVPMRCSFKHICVEIRGSFKSMCANVRLTRGNLCKRGSFKYTCAYVPFIQCKCADGQLGGAYLCICAVR